MKDFFFDAPVWVLCVLVAAGIAIWWAGNNRVDKPMKRIGLAVLLAGVALALTSFVFDTDQEKVTKQTEQLVQAVNARDWKAFESVLDATVEETTCRNRAAFNATSTIGALSGIAPAGRMPIVSMRTVS